MTVTLRVPLHTTSPNRREHWAARARRVRRERKAVAVAFESRAPVSLPAAVTLTRFAPRALDGDNLQGALKGVRDAVAFWLGCDDADPRVSWLYDQARCAGEHSGVGITVRELSGAPAPGSVAP